MTYIQSLLAVAAAGAKVVGRELGSGALSSTSEKVGGELVSEVDLAASREMLEVWNSLVALQSTRLVDEEVPETHSLLDLRDGEEIGSIDPIDGTGVFLKSCEAGDHALPAGYGSTVGILKDGRCEHAVMTLLAHRRVLFGSIDGRCLMFQADAYDALLRGESPWGMEEVVSVPAERDEEQALVLAVPASSKMSDAAFERHLDVLRRLKGAQLLGNEVAHGCAVGNVAAVLSGQVDAYINVGGGKTWDLAVPFRLATLAGCVCSTIDGSEIDWGSKAQPVICARGPKTHARIIAALS